MESAQTAATDLNRTLFDNKNQTAQRPSLVTVATQTDELQMTQCPTHEKVGVTTPLGQPTLCEKCSRSMLSYISFVQQFLENVAKDVSKQVDPFAQCAECVKESLRLPVVNICPRTCVHENPDAQSSVKGIHAERSVEVANAETSLEANEHKTQGSPQNSSPHDDKDRPQINVASDVPSAKKGGSKSSKELRKRKVSKEQPKQVDTTFIYNNPHHDQMPQKNQVSEENNKTDVVASSVNKSQSSQDAYRQYTHQYQDNQTPSVPTKQVSRETRRRTSRRSSRKEVGHSMDHTPSDKQSEQKDDQDNVQPPSNMSESRLREYDSNNNQQEAVYHVDYDESQTVNELQSESQQRSTSQLESADVVSMEDRPSRVSIQGTPSPLFIHDDGVDGILSTLYRVECGLSDLSKGPTVWERVAELSGSESTTGRITNEAFVTLARHNVDAIGCLVLGVSLLLCRTRKTLCVLVADGVSTALLAPLSSVFHVVQHVRSLDSLGTTKLALLDQPELGISFYKLNVWRLEQFTKCVYLNYDTLVVQNCDELFSHEELSAVPDTGWPDCFNSAVFVYEPSIETFWQLLGFAEKQGSYDGGDQGILNTFFGSWSQDINKKLSFIYNLMANVSYTYTPAFKQFGRNVKIVQFMGTYKPWHVKFFSSSGQIAPESSVHPTYVQFVHVWLNVFRVGVLSLFSQEIQKYSLSHNVISAHELLRFFPTPIESEMDFLLTPPSVRLIPSERRISLGNQQSKALEKLRLPSNESSSSAPNTPVRTTAETPSTEAETSPEDKASLTDIYPKDQPDSITVEGTLPEPESDNVFTGEKEVAENKEEEQSKEFAVISEAESKTVNDDVSMPGSALGNYQGMRAWEQGRMDYQGSASSDTIIKRLHFLMEKPDRVVKSNE